MKKQKKLKSKPSKKSVKSVAPEQPEQPDLVAVMLRVAERLGALEKKVDQLIDQGSNAPLETRSVSNYASPQHGAKQHQASNESQGRQGGRTLYQTVCADCRKACEVPFKPTGERPVYCKECFTKRKAGNGNSKSYTGPAQTSGQHQHMRGAPHKGFTKFNKHNKHQKSYQRA